MADIEIQRRHNLGMEQARHTVERLAVDLTQRFGGQYGWDGDTMLFNRSGAKGAIRVAPDFVLVMVTLGLMAKPFKGQIEGAINQFMDQYIGPG